MILVTVGTLFYNFDRLIHTVDELAQNLDEDIIIQYGSSSYIPKNALRSFRFTNNLEMESLIDKARIIITHAGAGTILQGLIKAKPMIIVPRLKEFRESVDNHQLQLARVLAENGRGIIVNDITPKTITEAINRTKEIQPVLTGNTRLVNFLHSLLEK